jgi:hypothetical protein
MTNTTQNFPKPRQLALYSMLCKPLTQNGLNFLPQHNRRASIEIKVSYRKTRKLTLVLPEYVACGMG